MYGILPYIWLISIGNAGINIPYMDPMGTDRFLSPLFSIVFSLSNDHLTSRAFIYLDVFILGILVIFRNQLFRGFTHTPFMGTLMKSGF